MEPFTPFASPYANGPPPWHHGGHLDRSFHDDSGYASEDSDIVPFPLSDPDHILDDIDQVNPESPRPRRHRAAAFVDAQWSRPAAFRAYHPLDGSLNDNGRTYDLPQPLSFEQQRNDYEPGPPLKPTAFYNHENFGREPGYTASQWNLEEDIPPLDFEEHSARVPDDLPSLSNRIESETDPSLPSSSSIRHESPGPEAKMKAPESRGSKTSAQPGHRTESPMRSSARRQRQGQSSRRDAQLATAWQQLYQERTELEKERIALRKKDKSLLHRKKRSLSSGRDHLDDMAGEGGS